MKLKILDLFSGLGGFSLGLERTGNFETIAFCDNDKYSNLVLQKHWKGAKIYNDVKEITKEKLESDGIQFPDIITGGFPCQPFSVAGKQKGTSDDRHLWPEMFRIIQEFKPRWVIGENVKGLVNLQDGMVFETVCTDLEGEGYEVRAFNIPAAGVGAPHRRERIWIVAHAKRYNKTDEIGGSDETSRGIQEEHRQDDSSARLTSRTSSIRQTNNGHEDMEDSNDNGHEGRLTETRNQVSSRQESQINGSENTDNSSRRSNGRGDNEQSRVDGKVQRLRDDDKKESTRATGIRGLHERTDISQGAAREDRNQEDDSRALVQEGQSRIQSSIDRGLEQDQTASKDNQVRQRDDSSSFNRMERRDENVEDSRRTLQQGTELREKNEDEVGEGYANQHQRSSSPSESNVANTERERLERLNQQSTTISGKDKRTYTRNESSRDQATGTEDVADSNINGTKRNQPEDRQGSRTQQSGKDVANTYARLSDGTYKEVQSRGQTFDTSSEGSTDVANTKGTGTRENDEGLRSRISGVSRGQGTSRTEEDGSNTDRTRLQRLGSEHKLRNSEKEEQTSGDSWWQSEPNVGRVAHGIPGRVYRLKGLGNSIIPKIAEEIGKAIIEAEREE